ncbi:MAG: SDH family Clp fold serine proteinase [Alphaproteobacteria bacterium]
MNEQETIGDIAERVSKEFAADVVIYNGPIEDAGFGKLVQATTGGTAQACVLMMATYGGVADAAYRISRWLQRIYQRVIFYPTSICASAGTLVALGAHALIMSPLSELGPLDVQLRKNNEIDGRKSGLVTNSAMEELRDSSFQLFEYIMLEIKRRSAGAVSFEVASNVAAQITSGLLSKVYEQIDPEIIGQNRRDLRIAEEYGKRLARIGKNITEHTIRRLVHGYPSHDFVIDREEAAELFLSVLVPSQDLIELTLSLRETALKPKSTELIVERLAAFGQRSKEGGAQDGNETAAESAPNQGEPT